MILNIDFKFKLIIDPEQKYFKIKYNVLALNFH